MNVRSVVEWRSIHMLSDVLFNFLDWVRSERRNETLKRNKNDESLIEMRMNWKDRKMIDFLYLFLTFFYCVALSTTELILDSERFLLFEILAVSSSLFSFFIYSLWKIKCLIYTMLLLCCVWRASRTHSPSRRCCVWTCHVLKRSLIMTITFNHIRNDERRTVALNSKHLTRW